MNESTRRERALSRPLALWFALLIAAVLGLVRLPLPLAGDQALFLEGAVALDHGANLYVDFWDIKQPGIFLFYYLGGTLFGFSAIGVHLFELLWLLLLAALLALALRSWLREGWIAHLLPLCTVGAYYAMARPRHMTQVEILVGFPLLAALWLASRTYERGRFRALGFFASGVCGGVVVLFKLMLAPLLAGIWLVALWSARRHEGEGVPAAVGTRLCPALAGALAPLVAVSIWLWSRGAFSAFLWTSLVLPLEVTDGVHHAPVGRLLSSGLWLGCGVGLWLGLSGLAWLRWRGARRELITMQLLAWLVIGTTVIGAQLVSWWDYQMLLLVVPIGLLGLRGLDGLLCAVSAATRARAALAVPLVALLSLVPSLWQTRDELYPLSLLEVSDPAGVSRFQRASSAEHDRIWRDTRFLTMPDADPGPIYVFGSPAYVQLAGRTQAIPVHGWAWELLPSSFWVELPRQLAAAAPAYVFVDSFYEPILEEHAPAIPQWLEESFEPVLWTGSGTWYRSTQRSCMAVH